MVWHFHAGAKMTPDQLEQLYQAARTALKARDFDRASGLLRQILLIDENYRDASRLLAQTVKLRRRHWYSHPFLLGGLGLAALVGLGLWLAPRLASLATTRPQL
jgi:ferric-dicitrate binding protein FerR (iron transport regulator)